jgi:hypothetical protein
VASVSKGTERTPPQLNAHYSKTGEENFQLLQVQLRKWKVSEEDILKFSREVRNLRQKNAGAGQMQIFSEAASSIQAAIHWVN